MNVASLYSGGKDSAYALFWALNQSWNVEYLVNVLSKNKESYMFHVPNVELTDLVSESTGIELVKVVTKGEKEKEILDLQKKLENLDIDCVVSGALASEYQRTRIDHICEEIGIKSFAPLWHKEQETILRDTSKFFDFRIVSVSAYGLDKKWLGKRINETNIEELLKIMEKYRINKAFEGGEAETFVFDAPFFKEKIEILDYELTFDGISGHYLIKDAELRPK
ncbi:putative ATP binding protein [Methanococcus vannielii SB]|uniref:ATP binding protein n=1 Tax=Methanococcus vannielii (strain ATCC 35089 / DSM 1224 / JCM 13029 / OCM 148 / SB) TaxID=406327 RepID=A6URX8_METVS|nr:TIGR00289 family protein [Methanococcus vannielii]ABR55250.1 putative ATP binding protein [Methanococcus vannielii SB]